MNNSFLPAIMLMLVSAGCVSVPEKGGFDQLGENASERVAAELVWPGARLSEDEADVRIRTLLSAPLTETAAIEIAILKSPTIQAEYFKLQAAAGEYVDGASLPNPFVSAMVLDVESEPVTNLSYGLGLDLFDILFFSRRITAAGLRFEAEQAETAAALIDYISEVRVAYYNAVAATQISNLMTSASEAAGASVDFAQALFDAGNIAQINLDREKLMAAEIAFDAMRAQTELNTARARLNALTGLAGRASGDPTLSGRLRHPTSEIVVETVNVDENLYLIADDARIDEAGALIGLDSVSSLIGEMELEFERERDDGEWERGIGVAFSLPVFNWGGGRRQAVRAKLSAMIQERLATKAQLESEKQILLSEFETAQQIALRYRAEVLPLAGRVLQGAQLDYNAMQIGTLALLDAKRDQLSAGRNYVRILQDYWVLRARYDQLAAGGSARGFVGQQRTPSSGSLERGGH